MLFEHAMKTILPRLCAALALFVIATTTLAAPLQANGPTGLADSTIVIIRHAEKPDTGSGLAPDGYERARRYVDYFRHFTVDGKPFVPALLFASADSVESSRPRLTLTPLSHALRLPIDQRFYNAQTHQLVAWLRQTPGPHRVLICWHHGEIAQLLRDFGADPEAVIHRQTWPGHVYDWAVVLQFGHDGQLVRARLEHEQLMPVDR